MESNINTPNDINDAEKPLKLNGTTSGRVDINVLKSKLQKDESAELKKNLAENKIAQMKEAAIKEIRDTSIKIAVDSVKKIITTSVDKSKLDNLFSKDLEETKAVLKKINS